LSRCLVTPSLHAAWQWFMQSDADDIAIFLETLNRVERAPSEAVLAGRQFENDVFTYCDGRYEARGGKQSLYDECVAEAAEQVRGGLRQERLYREARIGGFDVLLYGRADVIRRGRIYNLKKSRSYEIGKYTGSIQHPLYMWAAGIDSFRYIVSDGRSLWFEDYHLDDPMREQMVGEVAAMLTSIFGSPVLREPYVAHWVAL